MKFRYVGDGNEPPLSLKFMGRYYFELGGDPVEVEDEAVQGKLMFNPSFEVVDDAPVKKEEPKEEVLEEMVEEPTEKPKSTGKKKAK